MKKSPTKTYFNWVKDVHECNGESGWTIKDWNWKGKIDLVALRGLNHCECDMTFGKWSHLANSQISCITFVAK